MLTQLEIKKIKNILFSKLDPALYSVFIFGSRATGTSQKYSDIDIGIEGKALSSRTKIELEEEFDRSDLPYNIELVDFSTVKESFRQVAKQRIIPL